MILSKKSSRLAVDEVKKRIMIPIHSLTGITAFVATVQSGSFTEAAERLGITKSAVGKRVTKLEEHLGVSLLIRTTRGISLTTEGECYFQECSEALDLLDKAGQQLQANTNTLMGKLRLDLPAAFGRKCVMPILLQLMDEQPQLMLSVSFNEQFVDALEEGLDLMVRIGPLPDSAHLVARQLAKQNQILCASPEYLEKYGEPENIQELENHRCIVGIRQGAPFYWRLCEEGTVIQYAPRPFYELADGDAMLQAVLQGKGIAQLPLWLVDSYLKNQQLQRILPESEGYETPINLLWPKGRSMPPKTRYVIDMLLKAAKEGQFN
jgi:DNA-binding transcriptional LysR family regulator